QPADIATGGAVPLPPAGAPGCRARTGSSRELGRGGRVGTLQENQHLLEMPEVHFGTDENVLRELVPFRHRRNHSDGNPFRVDLIERGGHHDITHLDVFQLGDVLHAAPAISEAYHHSLAARALEETGDPAVRVNPD